MGNEIVTLGIIGALSDDDEDDDELDDDDDDDDTPSFVVKSMAAPGGVLALKGRVSLLALLLCVCDALSMCTSILGWRDGTGAD